MDNFYAEVVEGLLTKGILRRDMRLLVVCGWARDRDVLLGLGFTDVVISNLSTGLRGDEFAPYEWSYEDVERLTFPDNSFDFCIVHQGLHHCHSPHRALLEMYRVSRTGLLLFEPYDNFVTRLGVRLGVGQEYEHAAVRFSGGDQGGVANSHIPNFILRWTDREVVKTIHAFAPYGPHHFQFIHKMRIPLGQMSGRRSLLTFHAIRLATPLLHLFGRLFPHQCNNFAAVVLKPHYPEELHPWLELGEDGFVLNQPWLAHRYPRIG